MDELQVNQSKRSNKNLWTLMIVIVAIVCAIVGYSIGRNRPVGEDQCIDSVVSEPPADWPTSNPQTTATIDPATASWKTYKNDTYGYSFKYPSDWTEKTLADSTQVIVSSGDTAELVDKRELHPAYANNLAITRYSSINDDNARGGSSVNMKDVYANLNEYVSDTNALKQKTGETIIDGKTAYEVGIIGYGANFGIMLEKDKSIYEFSFERKTTRAELSKEENLILSTFNFTK